MQLGLIRQFDPHRREEYFTPLDISDERRLQHLFVIGRTGTGKSTALKNFILQDIASGAGCAFFDPHGDDTEQLLSLIPPERQRDVILYDPSDFDFPIGFNPLHNIPVQRRPFVASAVVDCFRAIWGHSWGPQVEMFVYAGVAALLDRQDGTLLGLKFLLTSRTFRARVLANVLDPAVRDFWQTDFETHMPEREQRERTLSTLNKIGALIADPTIRNSIGQSRTAIDFGEILDQGKIFIARLPQGELGIEKSSLIGALLLSNFHLNALRRKTRMPFHLYLDEFHHFGNSTVIEMLSGIRKFGVSLTIACQYLDQLSPAMKAAVLGTVGTMLAFRTGALDAETLTPEFELGRDDTALSALAPFRAYARTDRTTELRMPPMPEIAQPKVARKIRNRCRSQYALPRAVIDGRIGRFIKNTA
ncbi:type IV secretory system conjugative DNA transfer family protein [Bradyrhizobium sp.]|uniref:type IV secretory system conjugative DNA transfer family protein n=1 Tax=Bradyrhizobium sp. TaxID=376 RepID=UPI0027354944|nr:type IV secretion system DNA-binding domain-containing protein [Bradyrhizobium sp.]MDP3077495.1 type IV secretion system DNA-binding domain-containing protein [Bradyrhizobium sp.]